MNTSSSVPGKATSLPRRIGLVLGLLLLILGFLFQRIIERDVVVFSNDGPLGAIQAYAQYAFETFSGCWQDLNWTGAQQPGATPNLTQAFYMATGYQPVLFAKLYPLVSLLTLGLAAWFFFQQSRFHPAVCVLGALAATLNMNFFSNVCWGLATRAFALAGVFCALGLLQNLAGRWTDWLRIALAGLGVGIGIMEGYDVGALFSLYVAAFAFFISFNQQAAAPTTWLVKGAGRTLVIAALAALISAQTLFTLVQTQIKGVVEAESIPQDSAKKWNWTTQWSLPKAETLRVLIPGLYGYRMDTLGGGNYWGAVGQTPGWDQHHQGISRFSGSGEYAGVLVVLVALWAVVQSLGKASPFSSENRRMIWFWSILGLLSMLLAFGRFAPFYHLIYPLPFFNSMRNPIKFMHPFHVSLIILFGYGLEDLSRRYLLRSGHGSGVTSKQIKPWWPAAPASEKRWCLGLAAWIVLSLVAWLMAASSPNLVAKYIQTQGIEANLAELISQFCVREIGLYVLFLTLSAGLVILILSRVGAGARARWLWLALGLVLVVDLARANAPWVMYWNYKTKYENNPVINFLKAKAYQQRTVIFPFQINEQLSLLQQVYGIEWSQHHFLYYRIPSLDIIQEPRETLDNAAFRKVFPREPQEKMTMPEFLRLRVRMWELTGTRYILGLAGGFAEGLNQQFDPLQKRFRQGLTFALVPKNDRPTKLEDYTAAEKPDGPCALIEFTGALPKAKIYGAWQVITNSQELLQQLAKPDFDPATRVLVDQAMPAGAQPGASAQNAGSAQIVSYSLKDIRVSAQVEKPAVLLLNDKYDPNWKVCVDGKEETLFRANFLMRGVFLKPGEHLVEYRFQPPYESLYVSLAGWGLGLLMIMVLLWAEGRPPSPGKDIAA